MAANDTVPYGQTVSVAVVLQVSGSGLLCSRLIVVGILPYFVLMTQRQLNRKARKAPSL